MKVLAALVIALALAGPGFAAAEPDEAPVEAGSADAYDAFLSGRYEEAIAIVAAAGQWRRRFGAVQAWA